MKCIWVLLGRLPPLSIISIYNGNIPLYWYFHCSISTGKPSKPSSASSWRTVDWISFLTVEGERIHRWTATTAQCRNLTGPTENRLFSGIQLNNVFLNIQQYASTMCWSSEYQLITVQEVEGAFLWAEHLAGHPGHQRGRWCDGTRWHSVLSTACRVSLHSCSLVQLRWRLDQCIYTAMMFVGRTFFFLSIRYELHVNKDVSKFISLIKIKWSQ